MKRLHRNELRRAQEAASVTDACPCYEGVRCERAEECAGRTASPDDCSFDAAEVANRRGLTAREERDTAPDRFDVEAMRDESRW